MLRIFAILFGVIYIIVGILGFISQVTPEGKLFGLFQVNAAHNFFHLIVGFLALLAGLSSVKTSRYFFILTGFAFAVIAILGFFYQQPMLLGIIAINTADNFLHAALAVISLYIGFSFSNR